MERKFERSKTKAKPTNFGKINQNTRDFGLDADTIKEQQEKD
ncbi:hypothetical protein [Lentiprolixibacter aurantiacus]|uniref:Uncharacterized protein n=1 Tax=Lentiprolixibacter aurantiacus TaxID=2993939 RepID=A0AAE3MP10_9FLAO|nr:hypothetical protein [Lentiprolixibacter aurantiacus]MCX2720384.1 hypothetical protein [Lentiprolixibacter aurantiacus]